MAIIYNQNIGINYRGILNLDATTINTPLDATLRAVTDGAGTSSLLNLSTEQVGVLRTVNLAAGATNPSLFNVVYTINNSGAQTGALTGIFLNATETLLNGITHNLMDLQVGGVSQFRVNNSGSATFGGGAVITTNLFIGGFNNRITSNGNGILALFNNAGTSFDRLQLGGTTSSFPAIKRNGAAIETV
jgi:succinate dehydrogenase/fumarate reductase cytochrome b subunit